MMQTQSFPGRYLSKIRFDGTIATHIATNTVLLIVIAALIIFRASIGLPDYYLLVLLFILGLLFAFLNSMTLKRIKKGVHSRIHDLEYELLWKNLMIDNTDELFIVLNMYGQIVSFNRAFENIIGRAREDLAGQPLRKILTNTIGVEQNRNLQYILLSRFRDVFLGKESSFTLTFKRRDSDEIITISFRMIPIMKEDEVEYILVTGLTLLSDYLTNNFLQNESSSYSMENNLTLLYQLSYRITRNIESRMPKTDVYLMQMALQEVLINALEHGNLEIDFEKKTELKQKKGNYWDIITSQCTSENLHRRKIHVGYALHPDRVVYTIRDEGKGFDWKQYLSRDMESVHDGVTRGFHGMGLHLVRRVFDISFNEKGNVVTLVRQFTGKGE
jgi:two-component system, sensor histidine kinase LadS